MQMKVITVRFPEKLLTKIKETAEVEEISINAFIREAVMYRLKHPRHDNVDDFSSVLKEDKPGYEAPNLWDKMVLAPLLEILYFERLKADDKTKEEAFKKAEEMQKKVLEHYVKIKN